MSEGIVIELSVVIAARNAADTIADQLHALADQVVGCTWEVIVADNRSTDSTQDVVRREGTRLPGLRVVDASAVRGAGPARNAGAAVARGRVLAFCDADDVVEAGWLESVFEATKSHVFVTGPLRMLAPGWEDHEAPAQYSSHNFLGLHVAPSNNCAIRTDVFWEAGGFDPEILIAQDLDLSLTVRALGHEPHRIDKMVVRARDRPTAKSYLRQHIRYGYWDVAVYLKHRRQLALDREPTSRLLRSYLGLVVWFPKAFGAPDVRRTWLAPVGKRVGRLAGSLRHRTFFP